MQNAEAATNLKRCIAFAVVTAALATGCIQAARAQYLVSGNDEKRGWDETGRVLILPPGKDTVSIIDIRNRIEPRVIANLPLMNTISGPPTNLAVTPDNRLALVANGLDWVAEGDRWKPAPDDKLTVVDLTAAPPRAIATIAVGRQPAGMAINRAGNLALLANRGDNSVSVLAINGKTVRLADTVALSEQETPRLDATSVAITPDGKHALVTLSLADKVELLALNGAKVTDTGYAMATGINPSNVQITPDGKLGLVNNQGVGASDGQADTVSVIDLEQRPPRVIDQIVVGDGPEGLAVSPAGGYAAVLLLNGSTSPRTAFFHHDRSLIALLRIEGKKVRKVAVTEIGPVAEGVAFSPDGRFLYAGSFVAGKIAILRIQGTKLMQVGELGLPGHPASLRGSTP
jgi:DNA-binding beta-propeller fold protein YncE